MGHWEKVGAGNSVCFFDMMEGPMCFSHTSWGAHEQEGECETEPVLGPGTPVWDIRILSGIFTASTMCVSHLCFKAESWASVVLQWVKSLVAVATSQMSPGLSPSYSFLKAEEDGPVPIWGSWMKLLDPVRPGWPWVIAFIWGVSQHMENVFLSLLFHWLCNSAFQMSECFRMTRAFMASHWTNVPP